MLEAVLFDWGNTLMEFEWDDARLAAGHAAGLAALGRGEEAEAFTARFADEHLPALRAPGAAERLDYEAELRELLGPVSDDELDRFLEAEHAAWRPARALVGGTHALLEALRGRGLLLGVVANTWPDPPRLVRREIEELGVGERVDAIVLSGDVGSRKPAAAIFERALAELDADPLETVFVGDRLIDDIAGASALGMATVQAVWSRADDEDTSIEPDFIAFSPGDVLSAVTGLTA